MGKLAKMKTRKGQREKGYFVKEVKIDSDDGTDYDDLKYTMLGRGLECKRIEVLYSESKHKAFFRYVFAVREAGDG